MSQMAKVQRNHATADLDRAGILETTSQPGMLSNFRRYEGSAEPADDTPPSTEIHRYPQTLSSEA